MQKLADFIASGFYSGYLPKAPGTWGSVAAFMIAYVVQSVFGLTVLLYLTLISFFIGWAVSHYLVYKNPENLDPSYIVIDEFAGSFLMLWLLQVGDFGEYSLAYVYAVGFLLFRLFDILKPWPINWIENRLSQSLPFAGFAIMIDDILAALYPYLLLFALKSYL